MKLSEQFKRKETAISIATARLELAKTALDSYIFTYCSRDPALEHILEHISYAFEVLEKE